MVVRGGGGGSLFLVSAGRRALRLRNADCDFARYCASTSDDRSGNRTIAEDLPQISELEDLNNAIASPMAEDKRLRALQLEYEYLKFTGEPVPKVVTENMNQTVGK